jgi:glucosyl-dolichyl phosphate glucuronosyltransferase
VVELTIIVCTYNRAELLVKCLESLYAQDAPSDSYEVIVVDNNSPDHTEKVVRKLSLLHPSLTYIRETNIGLSYARNTGYKAAKGNWVGYIDDDALSNPDLITQALSTIRNCSFGSFGGAFLPWYLEKKPWWIPERPFYFTNVIGKPKQVAELTKGYITGCVAFYKKSVLEELGGFNTSLGMMGNKVFYGEETELQLRIQQKGYTVGYNPAVVVKHYVAPYKLDLSWFFKSPYAVGKSYFKTFGGKNAFVVSIRAILKSWFVLVKNTLLFKYEPKIIFIESLKSVGFTCGFIASVFSREAN